MELKAKVRATSTRGVRSAEIDENGDLIFTMTDGETLNLGNTGAKEEEDYLETTDNTTTLSQFVSASSHGHFRYIDQLAEVPMDIYDSNGEFKDTIQGSKYIRVGAGDIVNILAWRSNSSKVTLLTAEFYVYIYDENKQIVWDYLDHTDAASGERNRFLYTDMLAINGLQISGLPDGYYVRMAKANNCDCALGIWDGAKFGVPLSAFTTIMSGSSKVALPDNGRSTVNLGVYGHFIIAKPGCTITGVNSGNNASRMGAEYFPTQVIRIFGAGVYGANGPKSVEIVANYDYATGNTPEVKTVLDGDVSDYLILLDLEGSYELQKPVGTARRRTYEKAKSLSTDFKWRPAKAVTDISGNTYKPSCEYSGVPYRSAWSTACYVGWHTTKNTFMNAANDPNSIFYNIPHAGSTPKNGVYYSLVCSSFGTLAAGFNYPESNFGLIRDPNLKWYKANQPVIGELTTNGYGHCIVPMGLYSSPESARTAYYLVESGTPLVKARTVFPNITSEWSGIGGNSTYVDNYRVVVYPEKHIGAAAETPYDVERYTIVNGSARPFRGNQSVYTTGENVKINIYDEEANRLYYQKFTVSTTRGRITSATPASGTTPQYIDIEPGEEGRTVTLRSRGSSSYTGAQLENGAVYGVWASKDDAQTTPPTGSNGSVLTGTEFFEWYDRGIDGITYNITDGKLLTDSEFWYMVAMGYDEVNPYNPTIASGKYKFGHGLVSIPYEPKRRISLDPTNTTLEEHSDYSKYREQYFLFSRDKNGDPQDPVWAFFRKGKLGAYVMSGTESDDPYDEDPDD